VKSTSRSYGQPAQELTGGGHPSCALFGKPEVKGQRRQMGVALARDESIEARVKKALRRGRSVENHALKAVGGIWQRLRCLCCYRRRSGLKRTATAPAGGSPAHRQGCLWSPAYLDQLPHIRIWRLLVNGESYLWLGVGVDAQQRKALCGQLAQQLG